MSEIKNPYDDPSVPYPPHVAAPASLAGGRTVVLREDWEFRVRGENVERRRVDGTDGWWPIMSMTEIMAIVDLAAPRAEPGAGPDRATISRVLSGLHVLAEQDRQVGATAETCKAAADLIWRFENALAATREGGSREPDGEPLRSRLNTAVAAEPGAGKPSPEAPCVFCRTTTMAICPECRRNLRQYAHEHGIPAPPSPQPAGAEQREREVYAKRIVDYRAEILAATRSEGALDPTWGMVPVASLEAAVRDLEAALKLSRPSPAPAVEEALREAIAFVVRGPNQAHAYHECRYCGQTWWDDKEYHSRTCKVPSWRALLTQTREEGQG